MTTDLHTAACAKCGKPTNGCYSEGCFTEGCPVAKPTFSAPVMVNGLTEAETATTASVAGLSPAAAVEPSKWTTIQVGTGFAALMEALDRAERKGYMPDAIRDYWDAWDGWMTMDDAAPHPSPSAAEQAANPQPVAPAGQAAAGVQGEAVGWLRDQRGEYEGRETLDVMFALGPVPPTSLHGATYSPLVHPAPAVERGVAEERAAFEADRKLLGWASKADENGVPLLARHEHGTTWWGSENTMPTYRCRWTEAQWLGWLARAGLSTAGKEQA